MSFIDHLQAVLKRVEGYTHAKSRCSFHTIWSESLYSVNAKSRAVPAAENPWVKGFLPHIFSKKQKSILLDIDIE
jgi:hypothetical protein